MTCSMCGAPKGTLKLYVSVPNWTLVWNTSTGTLFLCDEHVLELQDVAQAAIAEAIRGAKADADLH